MTAIMVKFRQIAVKREVDTTNDQGWGGYSGTEYSFGKFVLLEVYQKYRFKDPVFRQMYVYGQRAVSRDEFLNKLKLKHKEEFELTF